MLDLERFVYLAAVMFMWWRMIHVRPAPRCSCNEEGSRMIASMVVKMDKMRKFSGPVPGNVIQGSMSCKVGDRSFRLTCVEVFPDVAGD